MIKSAGAVIIYPALATLVIPGQLEEDIIPEIGHLLFLISGCCQDLFKEWAVIIGYKSATAGSNE